MEQAIKNLTHEFFRALDMREHAAASRLMAPEGVWLRQGEKLTGPAAVLAALDKRPANRLTCHVVSNFQVRRREAERVELLYYLAAYESLFDDAGNASAPRLAAILISTDQLVHSSGQWRIQHKASQRLLPRPALSQSTIQSTP